MTRDPLAELVRRRAMPPPAERRALREAANLSQGEIADALGVARTTVTRWESGLRRPRPEHAEAYASLLRRLVEAVPRDNAPMRSSGAGEADLRSRFDRLVADLGSTSIRIERRFRALEERQDADGERLERLACLHDELAADVAWIKAERRAES